ncbi:MAG: hypothetical protein RLQ12_23655 [Cyclobacteriaceae bacterium]
MFGPSLADKSSGFILIGTGLFPLTTMTSADFSICTRHSETSLGKVNILVSKPATSTASVLSPFRA